jgi:hypothetical protein
LISRPRSRQSRYAGAVSTFRDRSVLRLVAVVSGGGVSPPQVRGPELASCQQPPSDDPRVQPGEHREQSQNCLIYIFSSSRDFYLRREFGTAALCIRGTARPQADRFVNRRLRGTPFSRLQCPVSRVPTAA